MLSVYTRAQIAIAVLHDLSSSKVLQPVKFPPSKRRMERFT